MAAIQSKSVSQARFPSDRDQRCSALCVLLLSVSVGVAAASSPVVADHRSPPRPIQPIRGDRRHQRANRIEPDRRSNASETTHVTEKTEKYERELSFVCASFY